MANSLAAIIILGPLLYIFIFTIYSAYKRKKFYQEFLELNGEEATKEILNQENSIFNDCIKESLFPGLSYFQSMEDSHQKHSI